MPGIGEGLVRLHDLTTLHPAIALRLDEAQGARPKQRVERSDHVPPLALRSIEGGPILKVLLCRDGAGVEVALLYLRVQVEQS